MKRASEVMNPDIITVRADTSLEEAIGLMLEKAIKRLPVLGAGSGGIGLPGVSALRPQPPALIPSGSQSSLKRAAPIPA
ncbi:MAG: CBS domain-containing protein [Syntrophobacteraceae bacterium]|nr:CBS domain-containing protein [Syntrophobacteraceae bacterium]